MMNDHDEWCTVLCFLNVDRVINATINGQCRFYFVRFAACNNGIFSFYTQITAVSSSIIQLN